ncbi:MAG: hypothetical protein EHM34_04110 [Nitrosopumilales archaeon]|nr:MAG: hypothetical protein EHM34_04110 [Nitrosopumilales archaeon]
MDSYKIILNEEILKEFIEWLPELQINEKFYVALFARKKYCREVKYIHTDKAQVKRFLATKKDLFNKIRQLEVPLDSYVLKDITIPQESLALYISVNPRDLEKGTRQSLIKFANLLASKYNGYNPVAEATSEVHKACSRKLWFDFDYDGVELDSILPEIDKILPRECFRILQTRSGFHVIVHLPSLDKKISHLWYKGLTSLPGCDVKGDNLLPVPGCTQGEFTPNFII